MNNQTQNHIESANQKTDENNATENVQVSATNNQYSVTKNQVFSTKRISEDEGRAEGLDEDLLSESIKISQKAYLG